MCGLTDLRMFSEIARSSSMSVAAGRLGMSPATISGRLKSLEAHFGVTLIRRTTRSLALTEEGRLLLDHAQDLLAGFEALEAQLQGRKRRVEGALVIAAPPEFGRKWVVPLAHQFAAANPDIEFHFQFDAAGASDIRADVSFRIGVLPSSTMTTRKLADIGFVTCAAPSYLAGKGRPETPADLREHDCLCLAGEAGSDNDWTYVEGGRGTVVRVAGRRTASDPEVLIELSRLGHGILRVHRWKVADALADGGLVAVLEDCAPAPEPLQLLSENRKLLPMRTIRFIDFVVDHFRREDGAQQRALRLVVRERSGANARLCA